jgi:hypothetical protein
MIEYLLESLKTIGVSPEVAALLLAVVSGLLGAGITVAIQYLARPGEGAIEAESRNVERIRELEQLFPREQVEIITAMRKHLKHLWIDLEESQAAHGRAIKIGKKNDKPVADFPYATHSGHLNNLLRGKLIESVHKPTGTSQTYRAASAGVGELVSTKGAPTKYLTLTTKGSKIADEMITLGMGLKLA